MSRFSNFPKTAASAGGPRDRDPRPSRRFRRRCRDHHPQASHLRTIFRRSVGAGAERFQRHSPTMNWPAGAIFARLRYRHHRRRNRARFRRCGVGGPAAATATTRCTSTLPTSAITCSRAPPSTQKPACAAPASIFRTAPCPCCRSSFPPNICSLKPQVDRLVLSALLEIDQHGDIVAQEFSRGVIRSAERMTYTDVHAAARRRRRACASAMRRLSARFELMRELALILNRKRVRRGSIDFDLPEPLIEFDEFGEMTGVTRSAAQHRAPAHRGVHAGGERSRGVASGAGGHRVAFSASTNSPIPNA